MMNKKNQPTGFNHSMGMLLDIKQHQKLVFPPRIRHSIDEEEIRKTSEWIRKQICESEQI